MSTPQKGKTSIPVWQPLALVGALMFLATAAAVGFMSLEKENEDLRNMVNILEASRLEACKAQKFSGACDLIPNPSKLSPLATSGDGTTESLLRKACKSWTGINPVSPTFCLHLEVKGQHP